MTPCVGQQKSLESEAFGVSDTYCKDALNVRMVLLFYHPIFLTICKKFLYQDRQNEMNSFTFRFSHSNLPQTLKSSNIVGM